MTVEQLVRIKSFCTAGFGTQMIADRFQIPYSTVHCVRLNLYRQRRKAKMNLALLSELQNFIAEES
jgi:hypothetical protein